MWGAHHSAVRRLGYWIQRQSIQNQLCAQLSLRSAFQAYTELPKYVCLGAHGRYAQKLLTDLFANYTNALRPVEDTDHIINVTLQITLSQIIDMDERNQILTTYLWIRMVWTDAYLTWKKEDYDGLDTIRIPSSYVWRPDIVLYNNADDQFSSSMETNVVIRNDGQIMWDQPAISKSSCSVDVSFFPFDAQQCRLTFGSWTHNGNQMDLVNALDSADLADFVANVEWEVLGMPAKKNVILYGCCSDPYPDITYTLHLKRRASFYIFNLLIPCMMISFLAPLGFYLPADSGEKVSLGVTVLLALTVFQLLVAESMPPSENVPLIGKYYIATMTMITASTALTIFIMNIHHCGPEARPVPEWARRFILHYLARICFVFEVGENCFTGTPKKQAPPEPPPNHNINPQTRGTNWDVNGQAWGGMEGRGEEEVGGVAVKTPEEKEEGNRLDVKKGSCQMFEPSRWKDDLFVSIDAEEEEEGAAGREKGEGGEAEREKRFRGKIGCMGGAEEKRGKGGGGGERGGARGGGERGCVEGGGERRKGSLGGAEDRGMREVVVSVQCVCQHQALRRNIEYIASCYHDQRSTQRRTGEWRKVAKVMDRLFMWLFFIMVFLMSFLIMGKAV
ncbi:neuronal acetylcholine receptor subunit alpha-10-like isoform X1 [Oncorhynchus tshawytscha]|uniref:neuronal acetylcholine receptor subunit alpha-10-like isoform X1 n=1 Tax=Oncorhynchus tshawytscha TaxID=74940 RepID=UPI001C3CB0F9|nr:neuronal acetylcholine receptor subunit alpha-10-like isoform X1 [Oncorhynchus tshawytscha]